MAHGARNDAGTVEHVNGMASAISAPGSGSRPLPETLAELHNAFERVHPFIDGNGRTGRLLLNLVLVRVGYPPVIVLKNQREQYLAAMRKADNGDVGPLGEILARAIYDNLNRFIVPNLAGPARIVARSARRSRLQRAGPPPGGTTGPPRRCPRLRRTVA